MPKAPLTEEQCALLAQIGTIATSYQDQREQTEKTRRYLASLIKQAKDLKLSTYLISEYALLSQPRISQIQRKADDP